MKIIQFIQPEVQISQQFKRVRMLCWISKYLLTAHATHNLHTHKHTRTNIQVIAVAEIEIRRCKLSVLVYLFY